MNVRVSAKVLDHLGMMSLAYGKPINEIAEDVLEKAWANVEMDVKRKLNFLTIMERERLQKERMNKAIEEGFHAKDTSQRPGEP